MDNVEKKLEQADRDWERQKQITERCKKMDRKERLQFVYRHVSKLQCSVRSIDYLEFFIDMEYRFEYQDKPVAGSYFNNVRQTKSKQLATLLREKDKPRKRQEYWDDAKRNFKHDISNELFNSYRISIEN